MDHLDKISHSPGDPLANCESLVKVNLIGGCLTYVLLTQLKNISEIGSFPPWMTKKMNPPRSRGVCSKGVETTLEKRPAQNQTKLKKHMSALTHLASSFCSMYCNARLIWLMLARLVKYLVIKPKKFEYAHAHPM